MRIGRRQLLGAGACVALSAATTSCHDAEPGSSGTVTAPADPTATTARVPRPDLFPGQPAPGTLYYGASVPYHRSLSDWESDLGTRLGLNRSYFTPDDNEVSQLVARCRDDLAHGRMPHVSIKPHGTWSDVAAGRRDSWLASMLAPLGELAGPVIFTLHHEPENDAGPPGMQPADFVGMQRRALGLAADLAPSVVVAPVLQHWTFDPARHDVDPGAWLVEEAPVAGFDVYNPWSPLNGKEWRSFGSKMDEVLPWLGDKPIVIGEHGCRDDPANPGIAAQWIRDAADYARTHGVVSLSYYNSRTSGPEGSWELTEPMESAFAEQLASAWVARPA
ncbi:hypothetical protein [Nocardioides sp. SYSU D00065]|uniref:hypothetical protein n=1 Tax=Nocardioides sp. SYSU D00065 TaxID=2817378 RepID=UPI001B3342F0|nr:hypothetical protein [Nocardioides sp. SYSU D00065]